MFLFVYGTLMTGMKNHSKISHLKFIENGITRDKFYMASLTCSSYPIISNEKINFQQQLSEIKGEIYEIDEKTLKSLDDFEGHPEYYTRKLINIIMESTDEFELSVDAFCYIMSNQKSLNDIRKFFRYTCDVINDGDWKNFHS